MNKIAEKLKLKPVQVYKWRWDRHEAEKRQRDKLKHALIMPERVFYITKMRQKNKIRKKRTVKIR